MSLRTRSDGRLRMLMAGLVVVVLAVAAPPAGAAVFGPIVQDVRPDGFAVVWCAPDGALPADLTLLVQDAAGEVVGRFTPQVLAESRYVARATGLTAGERYAYGLVPAGATSLDAARLRGSARTTPPPGVPFQFLAIGDTGSGDTPRPGLGEVACGFAPDVVLHMGDLVYGPGVLEEYADRFYKPYGKLLAQSAWYLAIGNHEYAPGHRIPALDAFVLPENGPASLPPEHCYWFDYGDVRFVAVNTNLRFATLRDVVAPWLDEVLAGAEGRWKVVFLHHPLYTSSGHEPTYRVRLSLVPVFDRQHVDVVFYGHNHIYERTQPLRAGEVTDPASGTVYITTGAGGTALYPARPNPPAYMVLQRDDLCSLTVVDVSPGELKIRQIGEDGEVIDEWSLSH